MAPACRNPLGAMTVGATGIASFTPASPTSITTIPRCPGRLAAPKRLKCCASRLPPSLTDSSDRRGPAGLALARSRRARGDQALHELTHAGIEAIREDAEGEGEHDEGNHGLRAEAGKNAASIPQG